MNVKQNNLSIHSGSALVFALLILLVMTILGVATMSNVSMQERMAGNVNLQAIAFEAASAGVGEALEWAMNPDVGQGWADCERNEGMWPPEDVEPSPPRILDLDDDSADWGDAVQNLEVRYTLRNDCLEDPDFIDDGTGGGTYMPPVQFYVTVEGSVWSDGTELARREIEVRVDQTRNDGISALRVEGEADVQFSSAAGNRFTIDGAGGPAISTSTNANAQSVATQIGDSRIANYDGGVMSSPYPPPFNTAVGMAQLVLRVKAYMQYQGVGNAAVLVDDCDSTYRMRYVDGDLDLTGNASIGTVSNPQITYVTGDLEMGGNASGAGLVIVEGEIDTNGTPDFDGLIIGLGGLLDMQGGGRGETKGMVFATNLELSALEVDFDSILGNTDQWFVDELYGVDDTDPDNLIDLFRPGIYQQLMALAPFVPPYDADDVSAYLDYEGILGVGVDSAPSGSAADGFRQTTMRFDGGGNHSIVYECNMVDQVREYLDTCKAMAPADADPSEVDVDGKTNALLVADWASFECNVPGRGASIPAVRSWRENLGWREQLTFD